MRLSIPLLLLLSTLSPATAWTQPDTGTVLQRTAATAPEAEPAAPPQRLEREAEPERGPLTTIGIGAGVLFVALIAAIVILHRRRSRQLALAKAEADRARRETAAAWAEAKRSALDRSDRVPTGESGIASP